MQEFNRAAPLKFGVWQTSSCYSRCGTTFPPRTRRGTRRGGGKPVAVPPLSPAPDTPQSFAINREVIVRRGIGVMERMRLTA